MRVLFSVVFAVLSVGCIADFSADQLCSAGREGELCGPSDAARCRGGQCCGGCFDGVACRIGDEVTACGVAGSMCAACTADERCTEGACLPKRVVSDVYTARDTVCAIDDGGALFCWGGNRDGSAGVGVEDNSVGLPRQVMSGTRWQSVATSWAFVAHGCGVRQDRSAWCWGSNGDRQLGTTSSGSNVPIPVASDAGPPWDRIAVAGMGSCGLREGQLYCWGRADEIPQGRAVDAYPVQTVPLRYGEDDDWIDVRMGDNYGCGLHESGVLECWGSNSQGQLGRDTGGESAPPGPVGDGFDSFSAGDSHVCVIKAGRILCWGDNQFGQCGQPVSPSITSPMAVGERQDWAAIAAGNEHSCAIDTAAEMSCWGNNAVGQLGLGEAELGVVTEVPQRVPATQRWRSVDASSVTCAITTSGVLYCWGSDGVGQQAVPGVAMPVPAPRVIALPVE